MRNQGTAAGVPGEQTYAFSTPYEKTSPSKHPSGGKKWTPAMTLPQIRQGIAMSLREALQCGTRSHMLQERQTRLQCNELARFYHWKQRNRLAPLNLHKRQF